MIAIHTYTDTKFELEITKIRLNMLIDKTEVLYAKYFSTTSTLKEIIVDSGKKNTDNIAEYIYELYDVNMLGTSMSLADEITFQKENIKKLENYLNQMTIKLSKMNGIEYKLYYEIVVKGIGISKAVENIASEYSKEPRTIWKNYYNKIKSDIKKLERFITKNQ